MAAPLTDGQVACAQVERLYMGLQTLALEGKVGASQRRVGLSVERDHLPYKAKHAA
jgi:hypothetical protein